MQLLPELNRDLILTETGLISLSIQLVRVDRKYAAVNFSKQVNNIGVGQMNVFGIGKLEVVNNTNR